MSPDQIAFFQSVTKMPPVTQDLHAFAQDLLLLLHDAEILSICLLHRLQVASLTCVFASHPGFDTEGSCSNVVHDALKSSVSNFKYTFAKAQLWIFLNISFFLLS